MRNVEISLNPQDKEAIIFLAPGDVKLIQSKDFLFIAGHEVSVFFFITSPFFVVVVNTV